MPGTDEDIIRDLLHRYTDHIQPAASIATAVTARQRGRDRRRVMSLAAAGAAVGTAAGVIAVVPGHSRAPGSSTAPVIRLTADQRELYHLSSAAARQPRDRAGGRYVVMKTEGSDLKDGSINLEDTSIIDSRTGNMWSYQQGSDGNPSGKGFTRRYSPTAAQLAAMPTHPAALRTVLLTQWDSENKAAARPARKTGRPTPVPIPITVSDNDKVFQQASDLLWNPLVSPALRAALYKVLAAVPGVTVNRHASDSTGTPAVEISRTDTSGLPRGKSDGITYATYEDPGTGAVLESTVTYPPGFEVTPQDPHGTATTTDITIYLGIPTWSSSVPGNPYHK
jgi:hypothetical protein